MVTETVQSVAPRVGFQYNPRSVSVARDYQHDKLHACGLDSALFDGCVDPSFFIGIAIHAGIASGISAEGNVNMVQSLVQHRPVAVDEALVVRGRITAVDPVPRGFVVDTDVWFEDSSGATVVTARRLSLKPDPSRSDARGAGARPPPVVSDVESMSVFASHTLTPERVKDYSSEGNSIHYDPEAALRAGFRAPIIGGGMGVHFLMAALWTRFSPESLNVDLYFRRPIFWDDAFTVAYREQSGRWTAMCLAKLDKVATEARINHLA